MYVLVRFNTLTNLNKNLMNTIQKVIQDLKIGDSVLGTDHSNAVIPTPIIGWFDKTANMDKEILVSLHMKHNVFIVFYKRKINVLISNFVFVKHHIIFSKICQ